MPSRWTRAKQALVEFRRRRSVVAGLTVLVLIAVDIPITVATARIWGLLIDRWVDTPWTVLREFFVDALVATFIAVTIWLIVALVIWAWQADKPVKC